MDVAIVGAGPAGLSAAYYLGDSGLEVVVFERGFNPRSKPCAGLVQAEAIEDFPILKGISKIPIDRIIVTYNDTDYEVEFEEPIAYVIDRVSAGRAFAGRMDAELELGASVIDVSPAEGGRKLTVMRTDGEREEFFTRYVLGADGIFSIVRRKLGFRDRLNDYTVGSAYQAIVPGYYKPRIFLGRWAPKGYARVYPSPSGESRIGLGTLRAYAKGYREKLFEILKYYDIESYTQQFGYVPLVGVVRGTYKDGAFILGDAAGHVQPLNGMGIYYALRAGRHAAEAIKEGSPEEYEKRRMEDFGGELSLGRKAMERAFKGGRMSKRMARIVAELILGRVNRRNLLKARLYSKLGL